MVAFTSDGIRRFRRAPVATALLWIAAPTALLAVGLALGGTRDQSGFEPWEVVFVLVAWLAVTLATVIDLRWGLGAFVLAAGISPEIPLLNYTVRFEDFIFVPVLTCWAMTWFRRRRMPPVHPLLIWPILAGLAVSVLATVRGAHLGLLPDPVFSWLVLAKRVEYFLIFWVVATSIDEERSARALVHCLLVGAVLSAAYGLMVPGEWGGESRIFAERRVFGPAGENYNTLSGYLVVAMCLGLALFPTFSDRRERVWIGGAVLLSAVGVLLSFSREGLIVLVVALVIISAMAAVHRFRSILVLALAIVLLVGVVPPVRDNATYTVTLIQRAAVDAPTQNSLAARYQTWAYRWNGWVRREPIIGSGVGCVALSADNEYLLRACETGFVGLATFAWLLAAVGALIRRELNKPGWSHYLAWGMAAAFAALLVQATVAVSFTTIRTMEPFWFALGLLAALAVPQSSFPGKQKKCAS